MRHARLLGLALICLFAVLFQTLNIRAQSKQSANKAAMDVDFERIKKDPAQFKEIILMVQMWLGQLGYGAGPFNGEYDERTRQAVAKFKSRRDNKPSDGELDGRTLGQIGEAWEAATKPSVMLPRLQVMTQAWDSFVSAKGTLMIEGQPLGIPLQTTELECHRGLGICIAATAMLQGEDYLTSWIETYEIERWDEHEIVTKPRDLECVRYTLRISRGQKSVTGLRSTTNSTAQCAKMTQEDLPLRLEDGSKAESAYVAKKREAIKKHMLIDSLLLESKRP